MKKTNQPAQTKMRLQRTFSELEKLHLELHEVKGPLQPQVYEPIVQLIPVTASGLEPSASLDPTEMVPGKVTGIKLAAQITSSFVVKYALLFYLAGIILSETLTTLFIPSAGVVMHAVVLAALFLHSAVTRGDIMRRILMSLSLAPLIRILSLSLPLRDYVFEYWYLMVGAPLFLSAFLVARYAGYRSGDIGLSLYKWPLQLFVGSLGVGLGYLEYQILRPKPLASELSLEQIWLPGLILFVFTGLLEEVIFRGLMQKAFVDGLGKVRGVLYVSVVFAVLHLGYQSALDVLFVFGVALLFGFIVLRSRSILGVTIAHGLTNIFLFLVSPFLS